MRGNYRNYKNVRMLGYSLIREYYIQKQWDLPIFLVYIARFSNGRSV